MNWLLISAAVVLAAAVARADPCEGQLPGRAGEAFARIVRYVSDGDGRCLGNTTDPASWIEVRLSDFDASDLHSPTGRANRVRLVGSRRLTCVAVRGRNGRVIAYDRVIASCRLNGRRVGDLLRAAGGREGGN